MRTVILCGGMGTRIRDVSERLPKPMVPIGGRPILWHIMKIYAHYGHRDFLLCLGYNGHMVKNYFLEYHARMNDFTISLNSPGAIQYHEDTPGEDWVVTLADTGETTMTGGRVAMAAARYLKSERFMLTYGDGVADVDIGALLAFHEARGRLLTITGVRPPGRFGEIEIGEDGVVRAFAEKPQATGGLINGGFMVVEPEFVRRYLPDGDPTVVLEREPMTRCAREGQMTVYVHEGFWQPMDTPREHEFLTRLWEEERAPWKIW